MHYLTNQDVIWIHLQIAKKPGKFDYAKLEEAVSYQYAYGKSKDVLSQASRFFVGFPVMSPFEGDNRAVALVAGLAFLALNGYEIKVKEMSLLEWFENASDKSRSKLTVQTGVQLDEHGHHATTREVVNAVLEAHQSTIKKLVS